MNSVKKLLVFALALVVGFSACKKDDETKTLLFVEHDITFDLPAYALVGDKFDITAKGETDPEDVTLYWVCAGMRADTVYSRDLSITIPDSLATYPVRLVISPDSKEYYSSEVSKRVTSIKLGEDGSIQGADLPSTTFQDPRDNSVYATTEIGDLVWFAENLKYAGTEEKPLGSALARADAYGKTSFGRLYTWNDATGGVTATGLGAGVQGACPDGWSVPTNEDWMNLAKALNDGEELPFVNDWVGLGEKVIPEDATFNGEDIWPFSVEMMASNNFGWSALAGGNCNNSYYNFENQYKYGFWWSSTENSTDNANYRYIYYDQPDFPLGTTDKTSFGASVRCVKLK